MPRPKKEEETVGVSYRLPRSLRDWLNVEAEKQERSANWLVNKLIAQAKERRGEANANSAT